MRGSETAGRLTVATCRTALLLAALWLAVAPASYGQGARAASTAGVGGTAGTVQSAPRADPEPQVAPLDYKLEISSTEPWTDTGIELRPGDSAEIEASLSTSSGGGTPSAPACDPEGVRPTEREMPDLPLPRANPGALIGRLSSSHAAPFLIGRRATMSVSATGALSLGVNTDGEDVCDAGFSVTVRIFAASWDPSVRASGDPPARGDQFDARARAMLDRLPRQVNDGAGQEGDMVNFVLVGSRGQVQHALAAAGWVKAERLGEQGALHALINTVYRADYLAVPMSELYLFSRMQDFGYEQGEPYTVVASRHHFRLWKAPWKLDGQTVWVGAGTRDIGFEKDRRNGRVTHRIDPHVDKEREFIASSLEDTGSVRSATHMLPSHPVVSAFTATGEAYQSDGRVLVSFLK